MWRCGFPPASGKRRRAWRSPGQAPCLRHDPLPLPGSAQAPPALSRRAGTRNTAANRRSGERARPPAQRPSLRSRPLRRKPRRRDRSYPLRNRSTKKRRSGEGGTVGRSRSAEPMRVAATWASGTSSVPRSLQHVWLAVIQFGHRLPTDGPAPSRPRRCRWCSSSDGNS